MKHLKISTRYHNRRGGLRASQAEKTLKGNERTSERAGKGSERAGRGSKGVTKRGPVDLWYHR